MNVFIADIQSESEFLELLQAIAKGVA